MIYIYIYVCKFLYKLIAGKGKHGNNTIIQQRIALLYWHFVLRGLELTPLSSSPYPPPRWTASPSTCRATGSSTGPAAAPGCCRTSTRRRNAPRCSVTCSRAPSTSSRSDRTSTSSRAGTAGCCRCRPRRKVRRRGSVCVWCRGSPWGPV